MKKVVFLCIMMLALCGCSLKSEYYIGIKDDKSMEFSVIGAFDEEVINAILLMYNNGEEKEYTEEEFWAILDESFAQSEDTPENYGFAIEKYQEGKYKGYKIFKNISNIDDISGEVATFKLEEYQNISETVVFVKNGDNYKANFEFNNDEFSSVEGYEGYENVGGEYKFVVTLPNRPISHNASEVSEDGKTLTWNMVDGNLQNIEFEFSFESNSTIYYIGFAVGIAVIFGLIIAAVNVSKNYTYKDDNE